MRKIGGYFSKQLVLEPFVILTEISRCIVISDTWQGTCDMQTPQLTINENKDEDMECKMLERYAKPHLIVILKNHHSADETHMG